MGLLQRYVMREVLAPLGAWLAFLFLLLWVMAFLRATDVLLGSAVTLADVLKVTWYLAPHFVVQASAPALLLALLVGLGRLADDRELTAMQSLGVAPVRLVAGPIVLSVALSACLLALACTLQPDGLTQVRELARTMIKRNLISDVKPGVFHDELDGFTLYAESQAPNGRWRHVLVHDGRDPQAPLLLLAKEGGVSPGASQSAIELLLGEGEVHRALAGGNDDAKVSFEQGTVRLGLEEAYFQKNRLRAVSDEQSVQALWAAGEPARVAFHWRLGQTLMPIGFAVLGAPLGLWRRGGGRSRGLLLTFAGYLSYYLLARLFLSLGDRGLLPAVAAGQLANVVFVALGALLLWRLDRRGAA